MSKLEKWMGLAGLAGLILPFLVFFLVYFGVGGMPVVLLGTLFWLPAPFVNMVHGVRNLYEVGWSAIFNAFIYMVLAWCFYESEESKGYWRWLLVFPALYLLLYFLLIISL